MACDLIAGLKIVEVFLCIVCLIYKLWTVWETIRVFYELEKQSREWPLSRRLAVDRTGSIFSDIVLGSYVIITIGLLIGHAKGELARARTTEGFFLVLGTILFLIIGAVSITSVDDVPHKLVDNGIILGVLTIITAILFLLDIGLSRKQPNQTAVSSTKKPLKFQQKNDQTQQPKRTEIKTTTTQVEKIDENDKDKNKKKSVFQELKSSLKRRSHDGETNHRNSTGDRTVEFQERESFHENERQKRAVDDKSPQVGRRNMENRGFSKQYHHDDVINEGNSDRMMSRRQVDPDEFERSFTKVEKTPNGYIKNEDRKTAFSMRDDERFYSREGDYYKRRDDGLNSSGRSQDYYPERHKEDYHRQPNGFIRKEISEPVREEFHRPNGHVRSVDEVDSRQKLDRDKFYRPNGYIKQVEEVDPRQSQRRHSIDYVEKEERSTPMRSGDYLRRSTEYEKRRTISTEESPRFYRRETDDNYKKSQEGYKLDDLRKPEYTEDRKSYKGYADTVKYLEETSSEKQVRRDDDDSAMPPKHVIELEMDDHYYRPVEPKSKRNERRIEDRERLQVAKVSSSQRTDNNNSSDDSELIPQIPSVSFLLSERGRKIMPSLSTSPVERVERVSTPKYYFADPSSPGYVKQTASHWPSPSPVTPQDQKTRSSP